MSRTPIIAVVLSLAGLLVALALPSSCLACSCEQPATPAGGWTRATLLTQGDVIFRGEVVSAGPLRVFGGGATDGTYQVTFQVAEVWKGAVKSSVVVQAGSGGGDCTIPFKVGEEWLIYGHGDPSDVVNTGICSRTSQLPGGWHADDLAILAAGTPPLATDPTTPSIIATTNEDASAADVQPSGTDTPGSQTQITKQEDSERSVALWSGVAGSVLALAVILIAVRRQRSKRRR